MTGKLFGVGLGPGDPELMTLKAVRILREVAVVALPLTNGKNQMALNIAADYLVGKSILYLNMPMLTDKKELESYYDAAFKRIRCQLERGVSVAYLTLGDPSLYSSFIYLRRRAQQAGYPTQTVAGVPSFCAVAARAQVSLAEGAEEVTILPAPYVTEPLPRGNLVIMKVGRHFDPLCQMLGTRLDRAVLVENCGLPRERVIIPRSKEKPQSYFSTMIVKQGGS